MYCVTWFVRTFIRWQFMLPHNTPSEPCFFVRAKLWRSGAFSRTWRRQRKGNQGKTRPAWYGPREWRLLYSHSGDGLASHFAVRAIFGANEGNHDCLIGRDLFFVLHSPSQKVTSLNHLVFSFFLLTQFCGSTEQRYKVQRNVPSKSCHSPKLGDPIFFFFLTCLNKNYF